MEPEPFAGALRALSAARRTARLDGRDAPDLRHAPDVGEDPGGGLREETAMQRHVGGEGFCVGERGRASGLDRMAGT